MDQDGVANEMRNGTQPGEVPLGALPPGYRLEEYELVAVLGVGGFGITYLANDTRLQMRVAIKEYLPGSFAVRVEGRTVHPRSKADEENYRWGLDRFMKEAQTLARFRHPNIVRVLRFFEANGTAYTVMEYEEGQSLAEHLTVHEGAQGEAFVRGILFPLLEGLRVVHQAGYLHRDIKPNNIYLRRDGTPVLIDFGSARQSLGSHTQNLTSVYTPGYAPFEQYLQDGKQGPWTDIYALGAVMYRMVAGYSPFDAAARMKGDTLVPAARVGAGRYARSLLQGIDQAMCMDERLRPQDIDAWLGVLNAPTVDLAPTTAARAPALHADATDFPASLAGRRPPPAAGTGTPVHAARPVRPAPVRTEAPEPGTRIWPKAVFVLALLMLVFFWLRSRSPQAPDPLSPAASVAEAEVGDVPATAGGAGPVAEDMPAEGVPPPVPEPARVPVPHEATADVMAPREPAPQDWPDQAPRREQPGPYERGTASGSRYPDAPALEAHERRSIEDRFRRADLDHRGSLSRQQAGMAFPRVARNFERADRDGDGRLSPDEIGAALAVMKRMQNGRY